MLVQQAIVPDCKLVVAPPSSGCQHNWIGNDYSLMKCLCYLIGNDKHIPTVAHDLV